MKQHTKYFSKYLIMSFTIKSPDCVKIVFCIFLIGCFTSVISNLCAFDNKVYPKAKSKAITINTLK